MKTSRLTQFGILAVVVVSVVVSVWTSRILIERWWAKRIDEHLDQVEEKSAQAIDDQLREIDVFFEEAKGRVPDFAQEVFGLTSKLNFISGNDLKSFLRKEFESRVLKKEDVVSAVNQVVTNYQLTLRSLENEMLVALEADVNESFLGPLYVRIPRELHEEMVICVDGIISQILDQSQQQVKEAILADILTEIVSQVAGQIIASVISSMGLREASKGLLSITGGGVLLGIAVGIVVDQFVYSYFTKELIEKVNDRLDYIKRNVIEGTPQQPGLRRTLQEMAQAREEVRRRELFRALRIKEIPQ